MLQVNGGQILQILIAAFGAGLVGYVIKRLGTLEKLVTDVRLRQVQECQEHRERIYEKLEGKVKEVKTELTGQHRIQERTQKS